jgi:hypothetical protein
LSQSHKEGLQTDQTEIVSRGLAMFRLNTPIWHYDARATGPHAERKGTRRDGRGTNEATIQ